MSENKYSNRSNEANQIIRTHMMWAMGAGLIPVPFADLLAVSGIQVDMIRQLAKLYDVEFKTTQAKAYITTLTGTGLARLGARAIKFIPGVGSILGGLTMSALSGASTYAIGEVFKKHFDTGGTFLDFDTDRLKKMYDEKFEKGKEVAEEIRKDQEKTKANADSSNLVDKLKELVDMKEKGLITDEEFAAMKKKLIG